MHIHELTFVRTSYVLGYLLCLLGIAVLVYGLGGYGEMLWPLGNHPPAFNSTRMVQGLLLGVAGALWCGWAAEVLDQQRKHSSHKDAQ